MNIAYAYSIRSFDIDYETNKTYSESLTQLLVRQEGQYSVYRYADGVEQLTISTDNRQARKEHFGRFLQSYRIDIMHILSPFDAPFSIMNKEWFGYTKTVITLNDVTAMLGDNQVSINAADFVRSCDLVIVHSEKVYADATELAGISPDRILLLSPISNQGWSSAANRTDAAQLAAAYRKLIRKKLAVFAPLTAARISEYAYMPMIAPHLTESFDCHFFTGDGSEADINLAPIANDNIRHHTEYPEVADWYDAVLYQLGNGPEYDYMIPYMTQYPGVVVVHEQAAMSEAWHNCLQSARLLVVHSKQMIRNLEEQGFTQLFLCNRPVKIPVMLTLLTEKNFVFSSFTENVLEERVEVVLRCLRRIIDDGYTDIQYMIITGADEPQLEGLRSQLESFQLSSNVSIHPRSDSQYASWISRSNVGITLRKEAGSEDEFDEAILDLLAYGKPSIVPANAVYEHFPSELVWQLPTDNEEEQHLYEVMLQLYLNKELRKKIRKQARGFMTASHTVPRYANELTSQISRIMDNVEPLIRVEAIDEPYQVNDDADLVEDVTDHEITPTTETTEEEILPDPQPLKQFHLLPNRFRWVKKGNIRQTYFSYNLDELPSGCTIISASMLIPVTSKKMLRVYRIKTGWSVGSISRKKPAAARLPLFKSGTRYYGDVKGLFYEWKCKEVVKSWLNNSSSNHGVLVPFGSSLRRPSLAVEVRYDN
jgi:hypothetical protein